jgi:hypothetical protein
LVADLGRHCGIERAVPDVDEILRNALALH